MMFKNYDDCPKSYRKNYKKIVWTTVKNIVIGITVFGLFFLTMFLLNSH